MHIRVLVYCAVGVLGLGSAAALVAEQAKPAATGKHIVTLPGDLKWGPAPPSLPPGAQAAVLDGDPSKPGLFAIRLKLPDGYRVAPHWHPTDENLVVLQGTLTVGTGDKVDTTNEHALTTGAYTKMPAEMRHYAYAKGETIFQIYGMGPFVVNYVNPSDDPQKKKP